MTNAPHGFYADVADLRAHFGLKNIADWSDPRGTGAPWNENIQMALDSADAGIIGSFVGVGDYSTPLTPHGTDVERVRRWAVVLAGWWLYTLAGFQDVDADYDALKSKLDEVKRDLASAKADGGSLDAERREPGGGW
jgi:phage gp36-like protein